MWTIIGCKSNNFYNRLISINEVKFHYNHVDRTVFKMLQDSLMGIDHLIYIYNHINHLPIIGTRDFDALVYDYKKGKTYYIHNKDLKSLDIRVTENNEDFHVINSVLKYYLQNKTDYLKSFENKDISEGGLWITYVYDIDVKRNEVEDLKLESLTFDKSGVPITFNEYMKGFKH